MPQYRRVRLEGGQFFFTVVTYDRCPILTTELGIGCLRDAWRKTCDTLPFTTDAVCVLPDHIHTIWTLPEDDDDYSSRWRKIKGVFSRSFRASGGSEGDRNRSRKRTGEIAIWQRRFWEHRIRDVEDFNNHVAYIHFNPVKHGHVTSPLDWEWSSFGDHVKQGWVEPEWGTIEPDEIKSLDAGE